MKSMFRDEQAKAQLTQWFDRFRARLPVPTESRTLNTKFGETHVLVGGPESGPPVIVLHGALATSAHVLGELAALMKTFRVYGVDIVGQSVKSADRRPSVSNNEYGEWMVEVMDGLGLPRAHVIGVSWGGFVSIRLAVVAPERINRLALLVPAGMVKGPAWAGFTRMGIPMMLYRMNPNGERLKNFVKNLLTTQGDDWTPYLGDAFLLYKMDIRVPALAKPEELNNLKAPTLVVAADGDVSFPGERILARAEQLFPALAGKELIKDCKHSPPTTPEFRQWMAEKLTTFFMAS